MSRVRFVVPALDEERNVPRLLADLEARPGLWAPAGRFLLVDDGSRDRTAATARAHAGALDVEVLSLGHNHGPGRAFDLGFRRVLRDAADDDLVVTLEADTTSDLGALARMLEAARTADLVLASVHGGGAMVGVPRSRAALSRGASRAVSTSFGLDRATVSSFFRVYRAGLLRAAYAHHGDRLIAEAGFACKAELLVKLTRLGARVVEVPVTLDARRRVGASKMRVLPTVAGYARLVARDVVARGHGL